MPFEIKRVKNGYKVCLKSDPGRRDLFRDHPKTCFSKKGLSLARAKAQEKAIIISEKSGGGHFDTFKEQLDKAGVKEKDYLDAAKAAAKKAGYNPDKIYLAEDNNHKLLYDGEHGLRKFGKVGYSDYLIYTLSPLVEKKEAEKHRLSYHKRFNKSALYEKDSPYILSLRILW